MREIRKRTITFKKTIRDSGDGVYLTPSTDDLYERIIVFCNTNNINVITLIINSPFEISSIKIMGTRKDFNTLLSFLKELEKDFIISHVTIN